MNGKIGIDNNVNHEHNQRGFAEVFFVYPHKPKPTLKGQSIPDCQFRSDKWWWMEISE